MTIKTQADAAPAVVPAPEAVANEEQRRKDDEQRRLRTVVIPPPAPGMAEQEDAARAANPQASWLGKPASAWLTTAAADTKAAALGDIAQAVVGRFNADAALAAGRAVTAEWISAQILTYQLPITEDDVRQAVTAAFGEAGIQVQG